MAPVNPVLEDFCEVGLPFASDASLVLDVEDTDDRELPAFPDDAVVLSLLEHSLPGILLDDELCTTVRTS